MTWTRHSDDYSDRAAIMALSDGAYRAHDAALIWSNRQLTSGIIPSLSLPVILAYVRADHTKVVKELEAAGLWERADDGWEIDWSDQEDADAVRGRRERNAARQAEYRERSSRHRAGDHSMCDPEKCKGKSTRNALRNALRGDAHHAPRNAARNGAPTQPIPTHPFPSSTEDGEGQGGPSAAGAAEATHPQDWDGSAFRPRDYLFDYTSPQHGGWDGPNTWINPSIWRDGWNGRGLRPATRGQDAA